LEQAINDRNDRQIKNYDEKIAAQANEVKNRAEQNITTITTVCKFLWSGWNGSSENLQETAS
jgi:uncharacterized protein (DUF3084 family)